MQQDSMERQEEQNVPDGSKAAADDWLKKAVDDLGLLGCWALITLASVPAIYLSLTFSVTSGAIDMPMVEFIQESGNSLAAFLRYLFYYALECIFLAALSLAWLKKYDIPCSRLQFGQFCAVAFVSSLILWVALESLFPELLYGDEITAAEDILALLLFVVTGMLSLLFGCKAIPQINRAQAYKLSFVCSCLNLWSYLVIIIGFVFVLDPANPIIVYFEDSQ